LASAVFSGSSDALHTVGDTKVTPDGFAVILGHQWSSGNLELGWDLVDVTVGLSPSGDLSNGTSWVFLVGNSDGGDINIVQVNVGSKSDDGVIVVSSWESAVLWMAGEGTSDKDLWVGVVNGSHSNISSEVLFAVAGRHDESSSDEGSSAEVGS